LANAIKEDRLTHAYLFCGPRGTGKTSTAKILAKSLNCEKGPTAKPCLKCVNCNEIASGNSIDVLEIDAASNRGIDDVRELREKVNFAPTHSKTKVYIIDEVHMLTNEAFNALLKMLEEPPMHAVFVLATTEPHKVAPTVASRCQRFDFRRLLASDINKRLSEIAKNEGIGVEPASLDIISKQSQGSLRDAIGLLDQLYSFVGKKIKSQDVLSLLNLSEADLYLDLCDIIIAKDTTAALIFAKKLIDDGRDLRHFVSQLIEHFRSIFIILSTDSYSEIIALPSETLARLKEQSAHFEIWEVLKTIEILSEAYKEMRYASDLSLLFEITLIKLTKVEADISLEGLLNRVMELEKKLGSRELGVGSSKLPNSVKQPKNNALNQNKADYSKEPTAGKDKQTRTHSPQPTTHSLLLDKVHRAWPVILEQVKEKSVPVYALLSEAHPREIAGKQLILTFSAGKDFHKTKIEEKTSAEIIKKSLKDILGAELEIGCEITDEEQQSPQAQSPKKSEPISKAHLVKLMKDSFGAEIVEELEINKEE